VARAEHIEGVAFVAYSPKVGEADELLTFADRYRENLPESVVVLASELDGRVAVVVAVGDPVVGRGLRAGDILKVMMPAIDGKGGGKPTLARGGGTNVAGIGQALEAAEAAVREALGS
jgi:alanyl-tRNA synthetase